MKRMLLVQQKVPQEQLQKLRRLMNAVFQIVIVCPDEGITEVPGVFCKNIVSHIKAERPKILDEENRCRSGVCLINFRVSRLLLSASE